MFAPIPIKPFVPSILSVWPLRFVTLHTVPTVKILLDIVTPPIELDDAVGDANLDAWADPLTFRVYPPVD